MRVSETPEALRARQAEHRLKERVRPIEPVSGSADPWLIADEALDCLDRVRRELREGGAAILDLEQAGELIRQLATGPED